MGVFNDANCYSACDFFSAAMQDSGAAVVFGEDPQTGGGGANVVEYNGFLRELLPDEFKPVPGGQDFRVAWRQAVRTGLYRGRLIEDDGIYADHLVRPSITDIFGLESSQWGAMAKILLDKAPQTNIECTQSPI